MKTSEETKRMAFRKAFISMIDDLNETAFKSIWDGKIGFGGQDDMPVIKGLHHLSPKGKDKLTILINKFLD